MRADAAERVTRMKEIIELLRSEEDPTVRAMAQKFADDVAGRLAMADAHMGMVDQRTFQALQREVQAAVMRPNRVEPGPAQDDRFAASDGEPPKRAAPRNPVIEAFLGCLFDFPALLDDPELEPFLAFLHGDAVFVLEALRALGSEPHFALDADAFLAKVPPSFHSFARHRLAAPVHQDVTTARTQLFLHAERLKVRSLTSDNRHTTDDIARAEAMGDEDEATALLREVQARARQKRGLLGFK